MRERKYIFVKSNMTKDYDFVRRETEAAIAFVSMGETKEDTRGGSRGQFVFRGGRGVGIT